MSGNIALLIVIGLLVACGVYLILERRVTKMLLGMILVGNAVNLLFLVVGGPAGDPLAQAMILTAIVITMGLAGFVLALAYRSFMLTSRDDVADDPEDVRVVARRDTDEPDDTTADAVPDPELPTDDSADYSATDDNEVRA
jgi:multicomponent Na+:H+ antiporter subunit C